MEVFGNGRFVSSDVSIVDEIELVEVPAVGLVFWWHEASIGRAVSHLGLVKVQWKPF